MKAPPHVGPKSCYIMSIVTVCRDVSIKHLFKGEGMASTTSCVMLTCFSSIHTLTCQYFARSFPHSQNCLLNLRSSVKKHRCDRILAPLHMQPSGLCLLWLASRITELCLNRKRNTLAAVLPSGISGINSIVETLKLKKSELFVVNVRIILLYGWGCYRCSSHSLRDLKGEAVQIFFYTARKKDSENIEPTLMK